MNWIKRKLRNFISTLMMALYNTEQATLSQKADGMGEDINHIKQMEEDDVMQDLIQGRITLEVKRLRWRMYKVLEASANALATKTVNEDGEEEFKVSFIDKRKELRKVKTDDDDDYLLDMVVNNRPNPKGIHETLDTDAIKSTDKKANEIEGEEETAVLGEITADEYFSHVKGERKIKIKRGIRPKFEIEKYAKKMNVKNIDDEYKMLEFYISRYPNEYDRRSSVLVKQIQKIDQNPRASTLVDIDEVSFVTYGDLGVDDNLKYEYKDVHYIKTVEFDGYYVLKFGADISIDGESIVEEFRMEELDKKYENKEVREESTAHYSSFLDDDDIYE